MITLMPFARIRLYVGCRPGGCKSRLMERKAKIWVSLLVAGLFYHVSLKKTVPIPNRSEQRERDLQELIRKAKQPVARPVEAHDLHARILTAFKRLAELVTEGGGQLVVILIGHPKLRNGLKRPLMKGKIGDRTTVFEFGGLRALLANQYSVTCWRGQGAGSVAVRQAPTFPG
jgi:type II secretory pathway predicted ATPase ExeA